MIGRLKSNITESDDHMLGWWNGTGMVVGHWGTGLPRELWDEPPEEADPERWYTNPDDVGEREDCRLRNNKYPLDTLPIAFPDINTLPIALYLGAEPEFSRNNIWYNGIDIGPENDRPLELDENNRWFRNHIELLEACSRRADGDYFVGMPALVPNLDIRAVTEEYV